MFLEGDEKVQDMIFQGKSQLASSATTPPESFTQPDRWGLVTRKMASFSDGTSVIDMDLTISNYTRHRRFGPDVVGEEETLVVRERIGQDYGKAVTLTSHNDAGRLLDPTLHVEAGRKKDSKGALAVAQRLLQEANRRQPR